MRRILSILLLGLGGWMLMAEIMIAFFDFAPGISDSAIMIGLFGVLSLIPLLLGAWASPGLRWQELGLTVLIATGFGLMCGVTVVAMFTDPGAKPFLPPMPNIAFSPVIGALNLILVAAIGWTLYRRGATVRG